MARTTNKERRILVAEDQEFEIQILKRSFLKAGISAPLDFVRDGQEAIDYLKGEDQYADRSAHPLPALVLLDLKMPRVDGFDVLTWLRCQEGLRRMPVVVLTNSKQARDIARAYDLGANSYLTKPASIPEMEDMAIALEDYWLKLNVRPDCMPGECAA
jgi:CheY-like chemotaxis protein